MDIHHRAAASYGAAAAAVRSPRQIEYQAFARVTQSLSEAAGREGPGAFPALAEALHRNLRLWTLIALDVADDGNGLPEALRARLFSLAHFTRAHTARVLAREAEAHPLIELNTTIMRGLRQPRDAASCPA